MTGPLASIDRRTLLIGGGAGIGLVVAFIAWPRGPASSLAERQGEQAFGHFLKIGRDGRVTVAVPQVETGQGAWTALPQIVADELGAAWETVAVEPAPLASAYANPLAGEQGWLEGIGRLRRFNLAPMRITAGSTSIRAFEHRCARPQRPPGHADRRRRRSLGRRSARMRHRRRLRPPPVENLGLRALSRGCGGYNPRPIRPAARAARG